MLAATSRRIRLAAVIPLLLAGAAEARADELKIDWGGKIQTDLRFRIEKKSIGDYYNRIELPAGVERNQNLLGLKFKATYGSYAGVANVDVYLNGYLAKPKALGDLSQ